MLDIGIMIEETLHYIQQLKLTKNSMQEIAESFGLTYEEIYEHVIKKNAFFNSIVSLKLAAGINILNDGIKTLVKAVSLKPSAGWTTPPW